MQKIKLIFKRICVNWLQLAVALWMLWATYVLHKVNDTVDDLSSQVYLLSNKTDDQDHSDQLDKIEKTVKDIRRDMRP